MKYLLSLLTTLSLFSAPALAVSLKQQAIVQGDVITVGDLFRDLEHGEDRVLGAAPRPGKTMVLDARTLLRVAKAMDIAWSPSSSRDTLVVRRAATVIDEQAIEATIRKALESDGVHGRYDIIFSSGTPEIILPPSMAQSVDVVESSFNPDTDWFEVELSAPSQENPEIIQRVSGKIERLSEIPVLQDTIRAGMVIGPRDIQMITIPTHQVKHNVFLRQEDLYGLTPRRMIVAGKPIKEQDVEYPRIVERGQNVTIVYKQGSMHLTAVGKALDFGAKGDIIRVVNNQTNRSIDAIVSGDREVTIEAF